MTRRIHAFLAAAGAGALGLAHLAAAQTEDNPLLKFNLTFTADEGLLNYNKGWDMKDHKLYWAGDNVANATTVNFLFSGDGFCAYGDFAPVVNFTMLCGPVLGNYSHSTDGSTLCFSTNQFALWDIALKGGQDGVRRLDKVTFFSVLNAPKGATMDNIEVTSVPLLNLGLYKNTTSFTYGGGEIEPCNADGSLQFRSGTLQIHPPQNTSFMIIRGPRGPTLGSIKFIIEPMDPSINNTFAININGPGSPTTSPLFNMPLAPWEMYNIQTSPFGSDLGAGFNFTSIDFYRYTARRKGSKTNVGAIAGGVVGGVVGFALLGVLLWYCTRRGRSGRKLDEKFQVDESAGDRLTPFVAPRRGSRTASVSGQSSEHPSPHSPESLLSPHSPDARTFAFEPGSVTSPGSSVTNTTSLSEKMAMLGPHDPAPTATTTSTGLTSTSSHLLLVGDPAEGVPASSTSNASNSRPTSKGSMSQMAPRRARPVPRHDEDAGALEPVPAADDEAEEAELLPPMYDPSWENGRLRVRQSIDGHPGPRALAVDAAAAAAAVDDSASLPDLTTGPSRRMSM